jgi:hypothetical protein
MKDMIMKPKIWLIVIAVMHSVMGVIVPVIQMGASKDDLAIVLYFLTVSVYLLYAAFMTEGKTQARLAAVLCAPVVVWFIVSAIMQLKMMGVPVAEIPSGLFPLIFWGLPTVTGIMNWNTY